MNASPGSQAVASDGPADHAAANGVFLGRYTAGNEAEFVLFLIGMRLNGLRGIASALRAFVAMPRMLASLARDPAKGCLGGHVAFGWRTAYVIQYWRSFDDLERFAKARDDAHFPAWRWYAKLGAKGRDTGIWHETYRVPAGGYESIYVNMPRFGLAQALSHVPVGTPQTTARERIGAGL